MPFQFSEVRLTDPFAIFPRPAIPTFLMECWNGGFWNKPEGMIRRTDEIDLGKSKFCSVHLVV